MQRNTQANTLQKNYQQIFFEAMLQNDSSQIENISIYHSNYVGRIVYILKLLYPATFKLVGEKFFNEVAEHFSVRNLPKKSYLSSYGFKFIKYMCNIEYTKKLIYLKELMYLEFIIDRIHNVAKMQPLTNKNEITPNSVLRLNRDAHLLLLNYNVDEIRQFCIGTLKDTKIEAKKHYYIVFRENLKTKVLEVEQNIYEFSYLLHKNKKLTLNAIFSLLNMGDDEIANALAFLLTNNLLVHSI